MSHQTITYFMYLFIYYTSVFACPLGYAINKLMTKVSRDEYRTVPRTDIIISRVAGKFAVHLILANHSPKHNYNNCQVNYKFYELKNGDIVMVAKVQRQDSIKCMHTIIIVKLSKPLK